MSLTSMELNQIGETLIQETGISQPFYSPNLVHFQEGAIKRAPGGGAFATAFRESASSWATTPS